MELYRCEPEGDRLKDFLAASVEAQRWQTIRAWLVGWLAFASLPLWVLVEWPRVFSHALRACVLAAWAVLAGSLVVAVVMEIRWHRRLQPFRIT